jgi:hypothetical protein
MMKMTGLILFSLLCTLVQVHSRTVDVSPLLYRVQRSPQQEGRNQNTRIFTNNPDVNSAIAGIFAGAIASFTQNAIFNPCPKQTRFGGNELAGFALGYGGSQLLSSLTGGCGK